MTLRRHHERTNDGSLSPQLPRPLRWAYTALACADPVQNADLIFVLAGRQSRKVYGLELFAEGRAPRILLSVARFEIRRFAKLDVPVPLDLLQIALPIRPPQRHFFVSFEGDSYDVERVPVRRLGTLGEIEALRQWLHARPRIASALLVTGGAHMRRVRMCCRKLLTPRLNWCLIVAPEKVEAAGILTELAKIPIYRLVLGLSVCPARNA
jgi:hypothetical protein